MPTTTWDSVSWSDFIQNYPTASNSSLYAFPHPQVSTIEPEEMPVEYYDEEIVPEWEEETISFKLPIEKDIKQVILRLLNDDGTVILHNTDYNFDVDYSYFELNSVGKLYPHEGVSKRMGLVLTLSNRTPVVK